MAPNKFSVKWSAAGTHGLPVDPVWTEWVGGRFRPETDNYDDAAESEAQDAVIAVQTPVARKLTGAADPQDSRRQRVTCWELALIPGSGRYGDQSWEP